VPSPPFRCRVEWCKACPEGNSVDIDGTVYHRSEDIAVAGTAVTVTAAVISERGTHELVDFGFTLSGVDRSYALSVSGWWPWRSGSRSGLVGG
jgi:hypothetical protein